MPSGHSERLLKPTELMASAVQSFRFTARRCQCHFSAPRYASKVASVRRPFSTTPLRREAEEEEAFRISTEAPSSDATEAIIAQFDRQTRARYDSMTPDQQAKYVADARALEEHFNKPAVKQRFQQMINRKAGEVLSTKSTFRETRLAKQKPGLLNQGEAPGNEILEDPDFGEDDITSLAHGEMEQHREMRHYARLAAWEMPLLTRMAAQRARTRYE